MENDSGDDEPVTMAEFMEKAAAEEETADLVLGGGVAEECTYKDGYLPRQAVFSCLTCVPQGNAGVCTACSITCHDGHEIVELWTKRQFRCDCGNSKFGSNAECKLWKEKDPENERNAYNQNFAGLYCTCHRRYPIPEDEELGEMFQCCICEDWFHEAHLGSDNKVPKDEDGDPTFEELICPTCADKCSFLSPYWSQPAEQVAEQVGEKAPEGNPEVQQDGNPRLELVEQVKATDEAGCSEASTQPVCKLKDAPSAAARADGNNAAAAVFLDKSWRTELCRCEDCNRAYDSRGCNYLLNTMDSLPNYEAMAKQKRLTKLQNAEGAGLNIFQNMNHVAKVEFLHGVNDMTSELNTFLTSFQESGKTVTSADIYEFFEQLKRKRRRVS